MARVDYAEFYRQWATLLQAGVTIHASLKTFERMHGPLADVAGRLARWVERGESVFSAMERERRYFPLVDRALVRAGEHSGHLAEVLGLLANWRENERRLLRTLAHGLAYPVLVFHAAAALIPAVPLLIAWLSGGEVRIGLFFLTFFAMLSPLYAAALLFVLLRRPALADSPFKKFLDRALLRIPLLGPALRDLALSRYVFAFHALYEAGTPILEVAELAEKACGNTRLAQALAPGRLAMRRGDTFTDGLADPLIPSDFRTIWSTAEVSGSLGAALARLATRTRERAEHSLARLATWVPRAVYGLVCLYVAYQVIRMFSRYVGMINDVGQF